MEAVWFAIVSAMLAVYAVLDGFDFGVGILHRFVARTDEERRTVLAAIGPIWDGNEVWLIAAGGVLFVAFPKVYATAFSGFYMALMIVLWLLILRGVAIEFRSHQDNPLWREFWDTVFSVASAMLAVVFGATLGNLVRGVPAREGRPAGHAAVHEFPPRPRAGHPRLVHGARRPLHARRPGDPRRPVPRVEDDRAVRERSLAFARRAWKAALVLWVASTAATAWVRPEVFPGLAARPWAFPFVVVAIAGAWGAFRFPRRGRELAAFLSSSAFLLGMVAATLAGKYPFWLRSTLDPSYSLTASNAASAHYGLGVALTWWPVGIALVAVYFTFLFRWMRGKVGVEPGRPTGRPSSGGLGSGRRMT